MRVLCCVCVYNIVLINTSIDVARNQGGGGDPNSSFGKIPMNWSERITGTIYLYLATNPKMAQA